MNCLVAFKKQIAIGACVAILAAITIGFLAVTLFPTQSPVLAAPLLGYLNTEQVVCSLSNGTCSMIVVNNSTVPVSLEYCEITVLISGAAGSSNREYSSFNGTLGGPAANGLAANSAMAVSCTIPPSLLSHESPGSFSGGAFHVSLDREWYSFAAGTQAGFNFQGTWS